MSNITEILSKIMDACKSDSLKIFVIICGCLYILGFSFNIEGYNINYANLIINLYIALFCSYAWERVRRELPSQTDKTVKSDEAAIPAQIQSPTVAENGITDNKYDKRNLLLNHRISIAQYDIHTVAMMFISIPDLSDSDYVKIREELDGNKQRFFMEYCWLHKLIGKTDDSIEDIKKGIFDVYDFAADELCKMFDTTSNITERVYGLDLIQKDMSKSLSAIFKCDEIIDDTTLNR